MIDLSKELDAAYTLNESAAGRGRVKHIFDDGELTFAEIRDILTKVFSGDLRLSEKVDGIPVLITYKDGAFCGCCDPKEVAKPVAFKKMCSCCKTSDAKTAFSASLDDLASALSQLDPVLLNKYFANGQNFMKCQLVCPCEGRLHDYGGKCFVTFDSLGCYDSDFKEVGQDQESAQALFDDLMANDALKQENTEISKPAILKIKSVVQAKKVLETVLAKLNQFIDGVGWKCTINDYVLDRYSRHLVNKALEHGLDVSRSSEFVTELASRLSNVSGKKPTRSDLVTFAKREGLDSKSDSYREFIDDVEGCAAETNDEIIKPIEDLIIYAGLQLMKCIEGFMAADPSKEAQKALASLDSTITSIKEGEYDMPPEKLAAFKKNLAKIEQYHEMLPAEGVLFKYKNKVYKMTGPGTAANEILGIIKYK